MALAMAAAAITGCSSKKNSDVAEKAKNDHKLTIGIKFDQPGLGLKTASGAYEGFDVDVAVYIANQLGVKEKDITWKETRSANRESFIENGTVDLVLASYSISAERQKKVDFGGPYYVAHQDIMVRSNNNSIKSFKDLNGKRVCQVAGSDSWKNITDGTNKLNQKENVTLVPANSYDECITKLKGNTIDALSTDDTILAGYAAREPGTFKVVGAPFTDERYGVGMKKGDTNTCKAVNKAITKMYKDGSAKKYLQQNFGKAGFKYNDTLPKFVGCGS